MRISLSGAPARTLLAVAWVLGAAAALSPGAPAQVALARQASTAPVHIQAEELRVDMEAGTAEFCGGVLAAQEDATLVADRLTIHYTRDSGQANPLEGELSRAAVSKLVAEGAVVLRQGTAAAAADAAVYEPALERIVLTGREVTVADAEASLRAERIAYTRTPGGGRLTADSDAPRRVKFSYRPGAPRHRDTR